MTEFELKKIISVHAELMVYIYMMGLPPVVKIGMSQMEAYLEEKNCNFRYIESFLLPDNLLTGAST